MIVRRPGAVPLAAGADLCRPADRAVPQATTAIRTTMTPRTPSQIRLTLLGRTAPVTGCGQQSASSNSSSNADVPHRTDANDLGHVGADHPKARTASDSLDIDRARLLIRGFGQRCAAKFAAKPPDDSGRTTMATASSPRAARPLARRQLVNGLSWVGLACISAAGAARAICGVAGLCGGYAAYWRSAQEIAGGPMTISAADATAGVQGMRSSDSGDGTGGGDDHFSHAAGRVCQNCDRPIEPRQPARRKGEDGWVHDACPLL